MYHKAARTSPTVCSRPSFETCGHHRAPASCKLAADRTDITAMRTLASTLPTDLALTSNDPPDSSSGHDRKAPMDETALASAQTEQFALHRLSRISLPEISPLATVSPPGAKVSTRSTIVDEAEIALPDSAGMHLLVMSPDSFNTYPLPKIGDVTIGRSGKSKIVIEDPKASREHARLFVDVEQGSFFVVDTGSANGTLVRDTVIPKSERVPVAPGEAIAIGS